MTVHHEISTPVQLQALMGADFAFSDQQFAVITAPLEPASSSPGLARARRR